MKQLPKKIVLTTLLVVFSLSLSADDGTSDPSQSSNDDAETMVAFGGNSSDTDNSARPVFCKTSQSRGKAATRSSSANSVSRYTVKKGDTLYSLSRRFGVSVPALAAANKISVNTQIKTGSQLIIPGSIAKTTAAQKEAKRANTNGQKFIWPVRRVVSVSRGDPLTGGIGIFIRSRPGSTVVSAADGVISRVGYMRGFGNFVMIEHEGRYMTVYSRIDPANVKKGATVRSGDIIGKVSSDNAEIHFQICCKGKPLDAEKILPSRS